MCTVNIAPTQSRVRNGWLNENVRYRPIKHEIEMSTCYNNVTNPASWVCVCLCFCPGVCFRCPGTHPVWLPGELACWEIDVHPHLYPISNLHTCPDHHLSPSKALTWHPFPAGSLAMNSMLCHSISLKLDRICFVVFYVLLALNLPPFVLSSVTHPDHLPHSRLVVGGFRYPIGSTYLLPSTHHRCPLRHLDISTHSHSLVNKYSPSSYSPCPGLLLGSILKERDNIYPWIDFDWLRKAACLSVSSLLPTCSLLLDSWRSNLKIETMLQMSERRRAKGLYKSPLLN